MDFPHQIDNTMRTAWVKCQRYAYYRFFRHKAGLLPSVHLHAGAAFASGIEATRLAYYRDGLPADRAIAIGWEKLIAEYGDFSATGKTNKSAHRMGEALVSYFDEYNLDTDTLRPLRLSSGKPSVEFRFSIPLPIAHPQTGMPILYCGRFDMLAERDGNLFVVDEKTTGSLGEYFVTRYSLSSQFTGYCWAAKQFNYPVVGAIVRGIGILKEKINHVEIPFMRPDHLIEEWYQQLLHDIESMIHAWKTNYWSFSHGDACGSYGGCDLLAVCQIHPDMRERYIAVNFADSVWNPLAVDEDN